jgi:hypothetical protein
MQSIEHALRALNAALDLDKNEKQVAIPAEDDIGLAGDIPRVRQSRQEFSGLPHRA